ncbi:coiled-coil domain-containing protein 42 isoform X1 [Empidonax traillii]|uniref:coiled-coil domain-containing protein 42 isoform X1 n=1 Tax=Empidonax traillii TaxID=164674 RepID=UPI000FFCE818|nr:coiled-coil domain-containing protein 42 isoform X1 [Empidonax traillii]XP_027752662.1 coiled-coil domain-containing protein 42 isoform X1 [Empidonax traillii]XP_027752663.1 coiled-coil domain-containing protein 42 isoform X1 [Empidonax traillii]XP_027752664.1 coiled-coil domain-containing protein 42 isoform X1 [Empidonax traillii]
MAGAMDPGDNENANYYREQYRANLLTLLRELGEPDEDPASSFMCLLKKKKELRCLEEDVEEKKEAFRERLEAIAEQWRDLHARRTQLKARVERSGRTVQENEMLRNQALRKASKDREENIKKENELLRAKRELEALRKQHQKLCQKLPKYSVFKRYLEDVVEVSQFRDIEDVISFYKSLMRSRKELLQSQHRDKEMTEQARVLLDQYRAQKGAEMLQCKNELVQLKQYLDKAQSDLPVWEAQWMDIQNRAAKKSTKLRAIERTIHGLFHAASTRLNAKWKVAAHDTHRQLEMIQQFIEDLRDISMEDMEKYK